MVERLPEIELKEIQVRNAEKKNMKRKRKKEKKTILEGKSRSLHEQGNGKQPDVAKAFLALSSL